MCERKFEVMHWFSSMNKSDFVFHSERDSQTTLKKIRRENNTKKRRKGKNRKELGMGMGDS